MKTLFSALLLLAVACASPSNKSNALIEKILIYQDSRVEADSLYPLLYHPDAKIVSRAIVALGQMQDTAAVDSLFRFAESSNRDWSKGAVFALGQTGSVSGSVTARARIETGLLNLFSFASDITIKARILEALGKTCSAASFDLIQKNLNDTSDALCKEAAFAAARMAIREIRSDAFYPALMKNLNHRDAEVRWASVYAIMRIHDKSFAAALLPSLKDENEQVRMDAARALGLMKLTDKDPDYKEIAQALMLTAFNDTEWKVRVNAVTALGNFKFNKDDLKKIYFLIAFEGKKDANIHVRIAAIRSMSKSFNHDIANTDVFLTDFSVRFLPNSETQEKGEILIALCQMFEGKIFKEPAMSEPINQLLSHTYGYVRSRAVEALGYTAVQDAIPYLEKALKDSFGLVQNNALEALSKIKDPASKDLIIKSLETKDITLLSIASGILATDEGIKKDKTQSESLSKTIVSSFQNLKPPVDVEAQMAIFDALGDLNDSGSADFLNPFLDDSDRVVAKSAAKNIEKITGEKVALKEVSKSILKPVDFDFVMKLKSKNPIAVIETNKGRIEIDFTIDEAPLTVMNFIKLSEKKFFDGLRFHRVVPNFVIQGGDPLGTGWGGPGYSIRSEFSSLRYERGIVGMASAGKDTEGCQWFITHSPQPHLDGRYTIFGRVRKGMDVVDAIQVGDTISQIKIIWR